MLAQGLVVLIIAAFSAAETAQECRDRNPVYKNMSHAALAQRLVCGYDRSELPPHPCLPKDFFSKLNSNPSCSQAASSTPGLDVTQEAAWKGCPLKLSSQIYIQDLWALSGVDQKFTVEMYFRQEWKDPRLAYNAEEVGYDTLTWPSSGPLSWQANLWYPDTYINNAISQINRENVVYVYPDGSIFSSVRQIVTLSCQMDFQAFPFDSQNCHLEVLSFGKSARELMIVPKTQDKQQLSLELNTEFRSPQWLTSIVTDPERAEFQIIRCFLGGVPWAYTIGHIIIKRFTSGWMVKAMLPANCVIMMGLLGFWINPSVAPARVTLCVITILTTVNLQASFARSLPDIAYGTWMDLYMRGYLIIAISIFIEYAIVNRVMANETVANAAAAKAASEDAKMASAAKSKPAAAPSKPAKGDDVPSSPTPATVQQQEQQQQPLMQHLQQHQQQQQQNSDSPQVVIQDVFLTGPDVPSHGAQGMQQLPGSPPASNWLAAPQWGDSTLPLPTPGATAALTWRQPPTLGQQAEALQTQHQIEMAKRSAAESGANGSEKPTAKPESNLSKLFCFVPCKGGKGRRPLSVGIDFYSRFIFTATVAIFNICMFSQVFDKFVEFDDTHLPVSRIKEL